MSLDNLHIQVDNLQDEKLNNDSWRDKDTPLEDLANRSIDTFQKNLDWMDEIFHKEWMKKLTIFLESIWGEFSNEDLWDLFEVLTIEDNIQNKSLENGLPVFGNVFKWVVRWPLQEILHEWGTNMPITKEEILWMLWNSISLSQEYGTWHYVDKGDQEFLNDLTKDTYKKLEENTNLTLKEIKSYMLFGPKLLKDIQSEKIQDYYNDNSNKNYDLDNCNSEEEKKYVLKLWDFMGLSRKEQTEALSNNTHFAEWLRTYWLVDFVKNVEVPLFSQSPKIIQKKTEIFNQLSNKLEWDELNQILSVYQVYLEYINESSANVESNLAKLIDFENMLIEEFNSWWDISIFVERLYSVFLKLKDQTKVLKILSHLRKMKSSIQNNVLEASIFAASFCPYAWGCIDMIYGRHKLLEWKNLSWENISKSDAWTQIWFWGISLAMDCILPWLWTTTKALLRATPDLPIINSILVKIQKLFPALFKILDAIDDNIASWFKAIKDYFVKNILPLINWEITALSQKIV